MLSYTIYVIYIYIYIYKLYFIYGILEYYKYNINMTNFKKDTRT